MTPNEQALAVFHNRVSQLILKFKELKRENEELYSMLDKSERDIADLRHKLDEKGKDFDALKTAKILEVSDDDLENTKARLNRLIREVNKCIALLKEQK